MSEPRPPDPPVLWPLVQTAHLARRRFDETFASAGVTGPQFGVLAALADGDDLSSSDLARAIMVRPQSMADLVDGLERSGLVERVGGRGRGRRTSVVLTEAGRELIDPLRRRVGHLADPEVSGLDAEESEHLRRLLAAVHRALSEHERARSEVGPDA